MEETICQREGHRFIQAGFNVPTNDTATLFCERCDETRVLESGREFQNPTRQVMFRAGLIAARESLARFVEAENPSIAASIRANWWPSLGEDLGAPRKLNFSEVTDGGDSGPWPEKKMSATLEALPIAEAFLRQKQTDVG